MPTHSIHSMMSGPQQRLTFDVSALHGLLTLAFGDKVFKTQHHIGWVATKLSLACWFAGAVETPSSVIIIHEAARFNSMDPLVASSALVDIEVQVWIATLLTSSRTLALHTTLSITCPLCHWYRKK